MTDGKKNGTIIQTIEKSLQELYEDCAHGLTGIYDAAVFKSRTILLMNKLEKTKLIIQIAFVIAMLCLLVSGGELLFKILHLLGITL